MAKTIVKTLIQAPVTRCFDLARDVGVHCQTAAFTAERAIPPGRTAGMLELGDEVTFEARHFGLKWRLTARIVECDRPARFVDQMLRGPFRSLRHVHEFRECDGATEMIDTLEWESPLGVLGRIADAVLVERHLTWFLTNKQHALREMAEAPTSGELVPGTSPSSTHYAAPVFIIDGDDVSAHDSLRDAVLSVEGVDVAEGDYTCFDAIGRRIALRATGVRHGYVSVDIGEVHVGAIEETPTGAAELRNALIDHLRHRGQEVADDADLASLVNKV